MKILNLYAGIGGNRKLWGDDYEITAVEFDPEIARAYQDRYPNDTVIVGDAKQYLLDHYKEFDFIWASPPCQECKIEVVTTNKYCATCKPIVTKRKQAIVSKKRYEMLCAKRKEEEGKREQREAKATRMTKSKFSAKWLQKLWDERMYGVAV